MTTTRSTRANSFGDLADRFARGLSDAGLADNMRPASSPKSLAILEAELSSAALAYEQYFQSVVVTGGATAGRKWKKLSPVTQKERVKFGFTPADPLYMSHTIYNNIQAGHSLSPAGFTIEVGIKPNVTHYYPTSRKTWDIEDLVMLHHHGHPAMGRVPPLPARPIFSYSTGAFKRLEAEIITSFATATITKAPFGLWRRGH